MRRQRGNRVVWQRQHHSIDDRERAARHAAEAFDDRRDVQHGGCIGALNDDLRPTGPARRSRTEERAHLHRWLRMSCAGEAGNHQQRRR